MATIDKQIEAAKQEAESLVSAMRANFEALNDGKADELTSDTPVAPKPKLRVRRTLAGHREKVVSIHWSTNRPTLVSAAQDGFLIVWDAVSAYKEAAVRVASSAGNGARAPRSQYLWCTSLSPSDTYVASGGMDNSVSIYNLRNLEGGAIKPFVEPARQLEGHTSRVTAVRFVSDQELLSAGDMPRLWDINSGNNTIEFRGHYEGEVNTVTVSGDGNTFLTGADDKTVRMWDKRAGPRPQQTMRGHGNDVRSIDYVRNYVQFVTGSIDGLARLFDIRAGREMVQFVAPDINDRIEDGSRCNSVCTSLSGRYAFAAYTDGEWRAFDTLKGTHLGTYAGHRSPKASAICIWSIGLSHDGRAVATASSDTTVKIWA